jgi:hypothetical protein
MARREDAFAQSEDDDAGLADDALDSDSVYEGDDSILTARNRMGRRVPPLVVGGLDEGEILAYAPAMVCDRVHWDTVDPFDVHALVTFLREAGLAAWTRQWSDGQHRVWVTEGRGYEARDLIRQWSTDHDVEVVNARVEPGVPFRDLDLIPGSLLPDLIAAAVDWLYPRMQAVRRRVVAELDLVDDEDVRSMMFLFVSDHMDRFDTARAGRNGTLTLLAFLIGKLRTWPSDLARSVYGRGVVADRLTIARAAETIAGREQRDATEVEIADALGISVTDLRRREQAISALAGIRRYRTLTGEDTGDGEAVMVQIADPVDVEADATERVRNAQLTRAIMTAVHDPESPGRRSQDPLALAAIYLSFWEDLSRPEVARELEILPKTVAAAISRVLDSVADSGLS